VLVWDLFVRLFHWSLLVLIVLALLSHGGLLDLHRLAGYGIAALIAARLVWGFIGSQHARFASFVPTPPALMRYLGQLLRGREPRSLGHNPAGAAMVLVLMAVIIAITVTGLLLDTSSYRDYRPLHAWHDALSDALLVLAAIHLVGVLYTSIRHRENLVRAMLTGRKRPD
jgi:cytochrome b